MKKIITILFLLYAAMPLWSMESKELEEIIENIIGLRPVQHGDIIIPEKKTDTENRQYSQESIRDKPEEETNKTLSLLSPDEALLRSGIQLFEASLYKNAQQKLEELKLKYPDSQSKDLAFIWLSKIHIELNNYTEAINALNSISQESGEYPAATFYTGEIYLRKGDDAGAIEYFYRIASLFPNSGFADDAYISVSKIYLKNGKGTQALEAAIKVIKDYRERETVDDGYFLLAQIFEKDPMLKDFGIARAIYKIFIKKADIEKAPFFANSPLLNKVKSNLSHIENSYYNKAFIKSI